MIKAVPKKGIYTSKLPGEKKKKGAVSLKNGQILWASKKGSYEGKTYYHLRNGMYLKASENYTEEHILVQQEDDSARGLIFLQIMQLNLYMQAIKYQLKEK